MCKKPPEIERWDVFVKTVKLLEKVGIDLLYACHSTFVLMMVDYFTRKMKCKCIEKKDSMTVIESSAQMFDEIGNPKKLIVGPASEFGSEEFKKMCFKKKTSSYYISFV